MEHSGTDVTQQRARLGVDGRDRRSHANLCETGLDARHCEGVECVPIVQPEETLRSLVRAGPVRVPKQRHVVPMAEAWRGRGKVVTRGRAGGRGGGGEVKIAVRSTYTALRTSS